MFLSSWSCLVQVFCRNHPLSWPSPFFQHCTVWPSFPWRQSKPAGHSHHRSFKGVYKELFSWLALSLNSADKLFAQVAFGLLPTWPLHLQRLSGYGELTRPIACFQIDYNLHRYGELQLARLTTLLLAHHGGVQVVSFICSSCLHLSWETLLNLWHNYAGSRSSQWRLLAGRWGKELCSIFGSKQGWFANCTCVSSRDITAWSPAPHPLTMVQALRPPPLFLSWAVHWYRLNFCSRFGGWSFLQCFGCALNIASLRFEISWTWFEYLMLKIVCSRCVKWTQAVFVEKAL